MRDPGRARLPTTSPASPATPSGWRPANEEELLSYCYQVAGAVGVMMAHVMGVDPEDRDTLDRAADLGIAFQLANIARDIVEDAKVGRTYLPADWLAEEGLDRRRPRRPSAPPSPRADHPAPRRDWPRIIADRARSVPPACPSAAAGRCSRPPASTAKSRRAPSTLGPRAWDRRISISKAEKFALVIEAFAEALWPARKISREGLWTRPSAPARPE